MASLRLSSDLSFCNVDGRIIFLDVHNDRYFRLSRGPQRIFEKYLAGATLTPSEAKPLLASGILTATPPPPALLSTRQVPAASGSALELGLPAPAASMRDVFDVFATTSTMRFRLNTCPLKKILEDKATWQRQPDSPSEEARLAKSALIFLRARKLVPIETSCLLDSLSMTKFLARRKLHASIVIGITGDPFTAHCWVQSGDLVLSDAAGSIKQYTVIRVV